ncbi:class I SAM-dependent DNA methyltransferase [Sediminibacillus massiliensis]|uniref:class I SAM-dependent DNA methyltransferase n=1 Tax=Sediminibacillus massiliensis TaxID=1926277 RepID=UPI0009888DC6|nr:class I SAM-dependent methyltransferase [Sediminibacillus massiliensis]
MSYAKMAQVYDLLMEDAPYEQWKQFAEAMFAKQGSPVESVVDLGCGTGQITRRLAREGYRMIGIDNSGEMLTQAQAETSAEGLRIDWLQMDVRDLQGFSPKDAAISFCDVINYITDTEDLKKVFRNVNHLLKKGGLFLFDVHSMDHFERDLKGQTFAEIYDDISYVWMCEPGEAPGDLYHDLTFFVQDEKQKYERFDERHHQRTHYVDLYKKFLEAEGFQIEGIYGDFSTAISPCPDEEERVFFSCKKIEEK